MFDRAMGRDMEMKNRGGGARLHFPLSSKKVSADWNWIGVSGIPSLLLSAAQQPLRLLVNMLFIRV